MTEPTEVGLEWGFSSPQEATLSPMTREEYPRWFGTWQGASMMAFKLWENLTELYIEPQSLMSEHGKMSAHILTGYENLTTPQNSV